MSMTGRFVAQDENADVAVLCVTYDSAEHLDRLIDSLRTEAVERRIRLVVVDNGSRDNTLDLVGQHSDVIAVSSGGNLGYAGGINVAMRYADKAGALLILNPDLWVHPGSIAKMTDRARLSGAGLVVPRILDPDGSTYPSIRREPTLLRAVGDAALGSRFIARPAAFSEIVADPAEYDYPHPIDWATGAAILIAAPVAKRVGDWDERFFMYSEETDFFRRARQTGASVWYEPAAVVHHAQGGSGSSAELACLLTVNRIRYMRKHHHPAAAGAYRGIVAVHELARSYQPAHRTALRYVLSEKTWRSLPKASTVRASLDQHDVRGSVIIPAHDEASVITRILDELAGLVSRSDLDVIVAANGCSDSTAAIARTVPGVLVIELAEPSKTAALNAAELLTTRWPRIYLDADVRVTQRAIIDTLDALRSDQALAARPPYEWDLQGASWLARRYYGARGRIPSVRKRMWGAGMYGVSELGRHRFGAFPALIADDLFIDQQFSPDERRIVPTDPVQVSVPRTTGALLRVLGRQSRGSRETGSHTSTSTFYELLRTVRSPRSLVDAGIYALLSVLSRTLVRRGSSWERDDSTREPSDTAGGRQ